MLGINVPSISIIKKKILKFKNPADVCWFKNLKVISNMLNIRTFGLRIEKNI
jgi:hypothetical protein